MTDANHDKTLTPSYVCRGPGKRGQAEPSQINLLFNACERRGFCRIDTDRTIPIEVCQDAADRSYDFSIYNDVPYPSVHVPWGNRYAADRRFLNEFGHKRQSQQGIQMAHLPGYDLPQGKEWRYADFQRARWHDSSSLKSNYTTSTAMGARTRPQPAKCAIQQGNAS